VKDVRSLKWGCEITANICYSTVYETVKSVKDKR